MAKPQSQGGVERLNEIIQNNLAIWMKKTTWHININSTHALTKQSPSKVMFGEESSAELKSHPPPQSLLKETTDEEEVEIFFNQQWPTHRWLQTRNTGVKVHCDGLKANKGWLIIDN
ncbi:conserved hypothetical protein [Trichinella spiralis]|uniref:hypothetical protein n=1 Tax=Trichinella spiralis TaxID=6334 RepID=UPI0001EFDE33|nr:conserved hypothetical protein [Trichinella spiralis]